MEVKPGCDGKVRYHTYSAARKKVRLMKRSKHIDRSHQTLDFYRCKECRFYHIGNSSSIDREKHKRYKGDKYGKRGITPDDDYQLPKA